jgi:hypothetical protein
LRNQQDKEEHIYNITPKNTLKGKPPVVRKWDAKNHDEEKEQIALRLGRRECSREFLPATTENQGCHCQDRENESWSHWLQKRQNILGSPEHDETAHEEEFERHFRSRAMEIIALSETMWYRSPLEST